MRSLVLGALGLRREPACIPGRFAHRVVADADRRRADRRRGRSASPCCTRRCPTRACPEWMRGGGVGRGDGRRDRRAVAFGRPPRHDPRARARRRAHPNVARSVSTCRSSAQSPSRSRGAAGQRERRAYVRVSGGRVIGGSRELRQQRSERHLRHRRAAEGDLRDRGRRHRGRHRRSHPGHPAAPANRGPGSTTARCRHLPSSGSWHRPRRSIRRRRRGVPGWGAPPPSPPCVGRGAARCRASGRSMPTCDTTDATPRWTGSGSAPATARPLNDHEGRDHRGDEVADAGTAADAASTGRPPLRRRSSDVGVGDRADHRHPSRREQLGGRRRRADAVA